MHSRFLRYAAAVTDGTGTDLAAPQVKAAYDPHPILRWVYRRFFSHIKVDQRFEKAVRGAAERGVPVYVMRSLSFLDFLCLDFLTKRFGLPLIRFANDLGLGILEPFGKGRRRLRFRRQVPEDRALAETLEQKGSALLFLRKPPKLGHAAKRGEKLDIDLIETLIKIQKNSRERILIVPQTFVWTLLPSSRRRSLTDLIFGPREWPGRIRVFLQFLLNYRNAVLHSGTPFDLSEFLATTTASSDEQMADRVRYALLTRLERERSLVVGPEHKTPTRIQEELIRSPRLREEMAAEAERTGKSLQSVEKEAIRELRKLCAAQDPYWLRMYAKTLSWLWNRIYDGVEIDHPGLERVRDAGRKGPVVLLPSHKSHVDYLVLSHVLGTNRISPPLIAAGDNLSFWPLGPVLRKGGGFFISRRFGGKKFYSALVATYIRKILLEGYNLEFFLEGGRSRTGKLLEPKFGLLSMVVDAIFMLRGRTIHFVPVSIGYERIVESRTYENELRGEEKKKEDISGLLRTSKILRSRYGRLYVDFAEPIPFDAFRNELGLGSDPLRPAQRRKLVQQLAQRTMAEINRVTVVTPVAICSAAHLSVGREGIDYHGLLERVAMLGEILKKSGARFAGSLYEESGHLRANTVEEANRLLVDSKDLIQDGRADLARFRVPDNRRLGLEFHKNSILHHLVPYSVVCGALVYPVESGVSLQESLIRRSSEALDWLRHEFAFASHSDELVTTAFEHLVEDGTLAQDDAATVSVLNEERARVLADLLNSHFESLKLARRGLVLLSDGSLSKKDWSKRTMSIGARMYLAGELRYKESLSKARIDNALPLFHERGFVVMRGNWLHPPDDPPDPILLKTLDKLCKRS